MTLYCYRVRAFGRCNRSTFTTTWVLSSPNFKKKMVVEKIQVLHSLLFKWFVEREKKYHTAMVSAEIIFTASFCGIKWIPPGLWEDFDGHLFFYIIRRSRFVILGRSDFDKNFSLFFLSGDDADSTAHWFAERLIAGDGLSAEKSTALQEVGEEDAFQPEGDRRLEIFN